MTERQKALLEQLPLNKNNLNKSALKAGYSENYAKSRIYDYVRNCKKPILQPEEKVRERYLKKIKKLQKLMTLNKDNTNLMRSVEIEGKVEGLFKDTINTNQAGNIVIIDRQGLTGVKIDEGIDENIKGIDKCIDDGSKPSIEPVVTKEMAHIPPLLDGK